MITEGQRSVRWTQGHAIRLRIHLLPFFGEMGLSEITAGRVQEYRVHRMSSRGVANPHSLSNRPVTDKTPAWKTIHNEIVTLRQVLHTAVRHGWLSHVPDISSPYRASSKVEHRPWFSPAEYKQLYKATGAYAKEPFHEHYRWNAEQVHDYVLFMANTGLRPDKASNLEHRDVEIVIDDGPDSAFSRLKFAASAASASARACRTRFAPMNVYLDVPSRFRAKHADSVGAASWRGSQKRRRRPWPNCPSQTTRCSPAIT